MRMDKEFLCLGQVLATGFESYILIKALSVPR